MLVDFERIITCQNYEYLQLIKGLSTIKEIVEINRLVL